MKFYLLYHLFRLPVAFVLDALLGDPRWLPHPVVWFGRLIARLERTFRAVFPQTRCGERLAGAALAAVTCAYAFGVPFVLLYALFYVGLRCHSGAVLALAYALDVFWGYQCLAARDLRDEAMRVGRQTERSLAEGQAAVARLVGRDTARLDAAGVVRSCVESVAESTCDGVVAPMIAYAAGGAPLALLYKAISTMDSMIGYRNDRYRFFGTAAARLDDLANCIPARVAALCLIAGAFVLRLPAVFCARLFFRYRPVRAARTFLRDRFKHQSPNAAQTESVVAGALGLRLGGGAFYDGTFERRPRLGMALRDPQIADIRRAVVLMYTAAVIALAVCTFIKLTAILRRFNPAWF
ncbi:MAG: cobalamin biosynthesis protein CobD [Treponema sp.]|nr:cobalamin biosynthesis protein CobD [Treponema sp.]